MQTINNTNIETEKFFNRKILWAMAASLVLGAICLTWAYYDYLSHKIFKQSALSVQGKIITIEPKRSDRMQNFLDFFYKCGSGCSPHGRKEHLRLIRPYYITIEYIDHLGIRQIFNNSISLNHYYSLNARFGANRVDILYSPDNPKQAVIDEADWHLNVAWILLGLFLLALSLGMLIGLIIRIKRQRRIQHSI